MFNLNLVWKRLPSVLMALLLLAAMALPVMVTQAQSAEDNPPTQAETSFSTNTPTAETSTQPVTQPVVVQTESAAPVVIYQLTADDLPALDDSPDSGQNLLMGYLLTVLTAVIVALVAQTLIIRKDLAKSIPQEAFVLFFEQAMKLVMRTETKADDLMLKSVMESSGYTVVKQPDGSQKVVPIASRGGYTPG